MGKERGKVKGGNSKWGTGKERGETREGEEGVALRTTYARNYGRTGDRVCVEYKLE